MPTLTTPYSRRNPSPRYVELLSQYRTMHTCGEQFQNLPPEKTFSGQSLPRHAQNIQRLCEAHGAKTLLDYGAGKGQQYQNVRVDVPGVGQYPSIPAYWGVSVTCYDPGYAPFNQLPSGTFDGVVCTDVLEHCPQDDVPWILAEMFSFAGKFLYANVACYPAKKRLSNGENAHCTIQPAEWWSPLLSAAAQIAPDVRYQFCLEQMIAQPDGRKELKATWLKA